MHRCPRASTQALQTRRNQRLVAHGTNQLYRYIYIVIFGKHLSELLWIVLICFLILNALLARKNFNIQFQCFRRTSRT